MDRTENVESGGGLVENEKTTVCPSPKLSRISKEKLQIAKSPFLGLRKLFQPSASNKDEFSGVTALVTAEEAPKSVLVGRQSTCSFINVSYENEVGAPGLDCAEDEAALRKQVEKLVERSRGDPKLTREIEESYSNIEKLIAANPNMSLSRAWRSLIQDYALAPQTCSTGPGAKRTS